MKKRLSLVLATCAATLLLAARPVAAPQCEFTDVERVLAVGDVHGSYEKFVEILKVAGLLDAKNKWSGGKAHLVQLGDVIDRGPDSRKAIDLLRQLVKDAQSAGGRVHALLGNHELMRILHDFR